MTTEAPAPATPPSSPAPASPSPSAPAPAATAAPIPASTPSPTPSTPTAASPKPDWLPENFFDTKAGPKWDDFGKHFAEVATRDAAEQVRRQSLPTKPDDYKVATSANFKAPDGVEFKIDEGNPLWAQ